MHAKKDPYSRTIVIFVKKIVMTTFYRFSTLIYFPDKDLFKV